VRLKNGYSVSVTEGELITKLEFSVSVYFTCIEKVTETVSPLYQTILVSVGTPVALFSGYFRTGAPGAVVISGVVVKLHGGVVQALEPLSLLALTLHQYV
jgi:hypothetical protein